MPRKDKISKYQLLIIVPKLNGNKYCLFPCRANIDEVETDVVEIEAKLDKLVKLCSGMIEAGRAYAHANKLFVNGIRDLSHHCKKEEMISECLEKCGESLQEIVNYHMVRPISPSCHCMLAYVQ
ncbi:arf-GAP with coiled-coil, ANK repeat and PH domain-containing protein 3-like [Misgurnus anguillicaudatus]|uniref:arf-GAP with coiled-coil, ANK repeat and PH domain-containing protein 3-like n=1 Tax=Misgurnus anguillicaudatus TaxID=75329 RepID=UPI003CCF565B